MPSKLDYARPHPRPRPRPPSIVLTDPPGADGERAGPSRAGFETPSLPSSHHGSLYFPDTVARYSLPRGFYELLEILTLRAAARCSGMYNARNEGAHVLFRVKYVGSPETISNRSTIRSRLSPSGSRDRFSFKVSRWGRSSSFDDDFIARLVSTGCVERVARFFARLPTISYAGGRSFKYESIDDRNDDDFGNWVSVFFEIMIVLSFSNEINEFLVVL